MNPKVKHLLEKNGFYKLTKEQRQAKHQEFIRSIPKILTQEEKMALIETLNG